MKYKDLYARFEPDVLGLGFFILVIAAMILVTIPAASHLRTHSLKSQALGPCFFSLLASAEPSNFDNYSGYSVIVEKVQKDDKSKAKEKQKTMYINGREYILR